MLLRGEFSPLLAWMREHVHRYGRKIEPDDLVRRAIGSALDPAPYLRYLHGKFAPLHRELEQRAANVAICRLLRDPIAFINPNGLNKDAWAIGREYSAANAGITHLPGF